MNRLKKFIMNLLDIIELHIPVILFSAVFIMYVIMIVYRYVLNKTVFQMAELCQVLYLASAMLGASYSGRTDNHVIFPLVYDKLNALGDLPYHFGFPCLRALRRDVGSRPEIHHLDGQKEDGGSGYLLRVDLFRLYDLHHPVRHLLSCEFHP